MCCSTTTGSRHGVMGVRGHQHGCFCGCHDTQPFHRRFMTQKQQITRLGEYLKELQEEARAVEEQMDQLKKKK
ncbi:MAG: hypothetical protein P8010_27505 [Desulfosarcinaceae bacterium]